MNEYRVDEFLVTTIGIVVFFAGVQLNKRIPVLRTYNIPEPVTGGLIAAGISYLLYLTSGIELAYDLEVRDRLLVYFFTAIGLNARISDLIEGGRPLLILLSLTLCFIVLQNAIGLAGAALFGAPSPVGVLAGSASLIGGHGTAIAWAPDVAALGVENAMEIGVACATLGLVVASLVGGPIAHHLIGRFRLRSKESAADIVGISFETKDKETINHLNLMAVVLTLHIAIILGYLANHAAELWGLKLPLFVTCLLVAILLSNSVPHLFPQSRWPARTPALALVSDFSLGLALAMSLMSMQLWSIAGIAGPLIGILILQTIGALIFIRWLLFPMMGSDYQAAVLSAGFGGFALGATPTAIANMTAVTKAHGPAPTAFIILPLVGAFFVDVTNAVVIRLALSL